jgi:hypothetical protein
MKNISKATQMQLAKKHPIKAPINNTQTKKVSREIEDLSGRFKHPMRNIGSRARAAKEVSFYVGIDLGDKKSNYCFLDAKGNTFAEGTLATMQTELSELFSSIPKCRIAIEVGTHSPWIYALLKSHGHEVSSPTLGKLKQSIRTDARTTR